MDRVMKKIGWGENLPRNVILEWWSWCMSKTCHLDLLKHRPKSNCFYNFTVPFTAIYISDDYIENEKTAPVMRQFFSNAPYELIKLDVSPYTRRRVGNTGIFRKRFAEVLGPWLLQTTHGETVSPQL